MPHKMELDEQNVSTRKKESSGKLCRFRNLATGGPKFPLLHEGDVLICRLNHQRTFMSKILGSKFLRRWESHRLTFTDTQVYSSTVSS